MMGCGGALPTEIVEEYAEDVLVSLILCRLRELRDAGCASEGCLVLAGRLDVDLDEALDLVRRGCAPALALRILL